jgi:hypothetical protein
VGDFPQGPFVFLFYGQLQQDPAFLEAVFDLLEPLDLVR